jgi:hypothetical protein
MRIRNSVLEYTFIDLFGVGNTKTDPGYCSEKKNRIYIDSDGVYVRIIPGEEPKLGWLFVPGES